VPLVSAVLIPALRSIEGVDAQTVIADQGCDTDHLRDTVRTKAHNIPN